MDPAGSSDLGEKRAVEDVSALGIALIVVIIITVIVVVWAGLRLISEMIGGVLGVLGPATDCGVEVEMRQNYYVNQGMTKCDAYTKAIDEVVTRKGSPCKSVKGSPPSACGVYAKFLAEMGCDPPGPCRRP